MMDTAKNIKMNALRFVQIVEAYGADPIRWPEDERAVAQDFAARHDSAAQVLNRAGQIDALLHRRRAPAPTDLLKTRILKRTNAAQLTAKSVKSRPAFYRIAAVILFAGIAGLLFMQQPSSKGFTDAEIEILTAQTEEVSVEYADAGEFINAQLDDLWDGI
ncbi:hypothetical protein [Robiginitomaculum antarcticum]|uniref:hypothetical protein n=1 Tax=Robiginitomaculum antarcticum TaxID=437507 RepID=UPI0003783259|nr:hypothetical protein [Robiginitomaculum antarcticum]